jgi:RNA polymerase sigma-70 factor (ECF subfamily)
LIEVPVRVGESKITLRGGAGVADTLDFAALVDAYQHKLFNTVLRLTGNHDDALDIVQDVFLKAYRSFGRFKGKAKVYTWLYRIAVNTALSFRRSAAVQLSRASVSLDENVRHEDSDSKRDIPNGRYEVSAALHDRELGDRISQAIAALEPELRAPVVLRDIEELSYEEIAEILEVPRGTIKSRLHRGRLILREKLQSFL